MVDKLDKESMAACTKCAAEKPASEFYRGHRRCKPCVRAHQKAYYAALPKSPPKPRPPRQSKEVYRAKAHFRRFNITEEQRDALLADQGGVCAICRTDSPGGPGWCTDHDHACCPRKAHSCGTCIRGVLCYSCNTILGHAKDSVERFQAAIRYIDRWEAGRG